MFRSKPVSVHDARLTLIYIEIFFNRIKIGNLEKCIDFVKSLFKIIPISSYKTTGNNNIFDLPGFLPIDRFFDLGY